MSKIRTQGEILSPGGGGVNVARVLKMFDQPCELLYISGGSTGYVLDQELQRADINARRFDSKSLTRVAYTVHQLSNHQEYRFVPDGPVVSQDIYENLLIHLSQLVIAENDFVVVSGSLPRGLPDDAYTRIGEIAAMRGARMILDTSAEALSATLNGQHRVFLVKPSLNELQRLAHCKLDEQGAREFSQHLVDEGKADYVAVSMGSHGAFLTGKSERYRLPAFLVTLRSAVGAGDSFLAALVYFLAQGHSMESAFRFGVAAGAAAVMTSGDKLCDVRDVKRLFDSKH